MEAEHEAEEAGTGLWPLAERWWQPEQGFQRVWAAPWYVVTSYLDRFSTPVGGSGNGSH